MLQIAVAQFNFYTSNPIQVYRIKVAVNNN